MLQSCKFFTFEVSASLGRIGYLTYLLTVQGKERRTHFEENLMNLEGFLQYENISQEFMIEEVGCKNDVYFKFEYIKKW